MKRKEKISQRMNQVLKSVCFPKMEQFPLGRSFFLFFYKCNYKTLTFVSLIIQEEENCQHLKMLSEVKFSFFQCQWNKISGEKISSPLILLYILDYSNDRDLRQNKELFTFLLRGESESALFPL